MTARAARLVLALGAAGSIGCMLRSGYRDGKTVPVLLLVLFTGWVLFPFAALAMADFRSDRLPVVTRGVLPALTVIVALLSLATYGTVTLGPPRVKPAAVFLLVPLGSCLLLAIVLGVTARMSRPQGRPEGRS